jgi:ArsR family transcriptional regulator
MPRRQELHKRSGKRGDWEDPARLLRVMAHPVRLRILDVLARRSLCVMGLNAIIPIPQPYLSQHMAALRRADLVDSHKDGTLRCYYLLRPTLVRAVLAVFKEEHPILLKDRESVQREARGEILPA